MAAKISAVCALFALVFFPLPGGGPPAVSLPGCEPTAAVDVSAHVVSITENAGRLEATVEVTIRSHLDLPAARVRARRGGRGPADLVLDDPIGSVARNTVRKRQFTVDLAPGAENPLYVSVLSDDRTATPIVSTAFLKVDLDPSRAPERIDDVMQYRARMGEP